MRMRGHEFHCGRVPSRKERARSSRIPRSDGCLFGEGQMVLCRSRLPTAIRARPTEHEKIPRRIGITATVPTAGTSYLCSPCGNKQTIQVKPAAVG
jgi:hypothetical protein